MQTDIELSIVVPAYNEAHRITPTLIEIFEHFKNYTVNYEVLVIDDCSTDNTSEVATTLSKTDPRIKILRLPKNLGKGGAVRHGVLNSKGSYILFTDADGSTPIAEYHKLRKELVSCELAFGSRAIVSSDSLVKARWYRKILGRCFNLAVNFLILPGIADSQCGFKLFHRNAALFLFNRQTALRYSFDVEILFLARQSGMRWVEVPVNWHHVSGSKVNLVRDSLRMLIDILHFRIIHRSVPAFKAIGA